MTEEASKRYEEIQSKIEKSISPYITIKIPIPEGVDKEEFLNLEKDLEFIESVRKYVVEWLKQRTGP
jgi:tetrahydromethanopterin S-methyltransferase subunit G